MERSFRMDITELGPAIARWICNRRVPPPAILCYSCSDRLAKLMEVNPQECARQLVRRLGDNQLIRFGPAPSDDLQTVGF